MQESALKSAVGWNQAEAAFTGWGHRKKKDCRGEGTPEERKQGESCWLHSKDRMLWLAHTQQAAVSNTLLW